MTLMLMEQPYVVGCPAAARRHEWNREILRSTNWTARRSVVDRAWKARRACDPLSVLTVQIEALATDVIS
jgi:hypothetical protein